MFSSNKNNILLVSILFILIGIFLRIYQLNFENYWLDEMTSFWVADPNLSLERKTFFDPEHTLIKGNKIIANKIYLDLLNIFKTHLLN